MRVLVLSRPLLGAGVAMLVALLLQVRFTQSMLDNGSQRVHTQRIGKLHYELCANGEVRVHHAEEPAVHTVGIRMSIADWRVMQTDFEDFVHGFEN
jgi:hypothetical protein